MLVPAVQSEWVWLGAGLGKAKACWVEGGRARASYHSARGVQPVEARLTRFTLLPLKSAESLFARSSV